MEYSEQSLDGLLTQIVAGDEEALAELVRRFNPYIISLSKVNGVYDEDVAQDIRETLIRALRNKMKPPRRGGL